MKRVGVMVLSCVLATVGLVAVTVPQAPVAGAATGDISTIAGTGSFGYSGDGGPATSAQIDLLSAITVDASGNTIIAGDQFPNGDYVVRKISPAGTISTLAGTGVRGSDGDGGPANLAKIDEPESLAADAVGNVYIGEHGSHRVRKVSPDGTITTVAGDGTTPGCVPGISMCTNGEGGPATLAQIWSPAGLTVDRLGNLYIADSTCANIRVVDTAGNIHTIIGNVNAPWYCYNPPSPLAIPEDVAVDDLGNLYIKDANYIRRWDGANLVTIAGTGTNKVGDAGYSGDGGPATLATINDPTSITLDGSGALFLAVGSRIRKIDRSGIITTVAGNGTVGYSGDGGPATSANIRETGGAAIDGLGNLIIADGGYAHVRLVSGITVPRPVGLSAGEQFGGFNPAEPCFACALKSLSTFTEWPVDAATGNFWHTFNLMSIPGRGPALGLSLTYNSLGAATSGRFGNGWQDSYGTNLTIGSGNNPVTVNQENGAQVTFSLVNGGYVAPLRVQATLTHNGDGTWTFLRKQRDTFKFNALGQLTSITDLNGYSTTLSYTSGQLTAVTDPEGRTLTFGYTGSLVTTVTDTTGSRSVLLGYTGTDLTSITDIGGGVTTMSYSGTHQLLQMLDPNQQSAVTKHYLTNVYDPVSGKVTSQTDFAGRVTAFDYTTIAGATKVTDPKGNVTVEQFTGGLPTAITRGYGTGSAATWVQSFDANSFLPVCATAPDGLKTYLTYDARGNQTTATVGATICDPSNATGRTTTRTYDSLNDVLTVKDPKNVTTTYGYDAAGNLLSVSTPIDTHPGSNLAVSYAYDPGHAGDVQTMTDPHGKVWTYGYDSNGLRSNVTDPNTKVTKSCYDTIGRHTRLVTPQGVNAGVTCTSGSPTYTTLYTTNAYGDLLTSTDALGHQTVQTYYPDRTLKTVKDAKNQTTTYEYNLDNELIQVDRPDLTTVKTDYWPDGSLKSQTDGANQTTNYAYDPLGHLAAVTDPLNRATAYTYDAVGNLRTKADPGGTCGGTPSGCTTYTPDSFEQLRTVAYSDGATPGVTYSYDNDGQRLSMIDGTGTSSWVWDSVHRLTSSTDGAGQATGYDYDLAARQETVTYPGNKTVTRRYDSAGRPDSTTDWATHQTSYSYDDNSNQTGQTNGDTTTVINLPDAADRLMGITHKLAAATLADFTYTRDNNNMLASVTSTGVGTNETYLHNTLNQLSNVNAATYNYDAADNLTKHADGTLQRYDVANELCYSSPTSSAAACGSTPPTDATTYMNDTRGNRTTKLVPSGGQTGYAFDQANRLKTANVPYESGNLGQFTPLTPVRVLNTQSAGFGTCYQPNNTSTSCVSSLTANTPRYFQVAGYAGSGVPASGVDAVAVNVTAFTPSAAGSLTVYSSTGTTPGTRDLTFASGITNSTAVIAKLGTDGRLAINSNKATNVAVEVLGYYAASTGAKGGAYTPLPPTQITTGSLAISGTVNVQVAGQGGVPAVATAGGVSGAMVQVKVTSTTATGFAQLWDTGSTRPNARNLSFVSADTVIETIPTKLSATGQLSLFASGSGFTYTVTVVGWYSSTPIASGNLNVSQTSTRVLKTSSTPIGVCTPSPCATLGANAQLSVQVSGQAGVPSTGVTAVTVVATDLTITGSTAGNLALSNTAGTPNPTVYIAAGESESNTAVVPLDADGKIVVKNNTSANRDVFLEVIGWQEPATKAWTYTYNGDGLRTKKTAPDGTITTYAWDKSGSLPLLVAETTGANITRYIYGPGGLPIEDVQPDGTARYYHHDQIGSTRLLTSQAGAVTGTTTYNAYGKPTTTTGSATTPLGYAGQYTDSETGLQYLRARYYDPGTGQLITRDPMFSSTRSAYGYAQGAPLSATDPSGLDIWDDTGLADAWNATGGSVAHGAAYVANEVGSFVDRQCLGSWQDAAGCAAVVVGGVALGAGGLALLGVGGGLAGGLGTTATLAGWAGTSLQGALTYDDCRHGIDGSCLINFGSTLTAGFGSGLGTFAGEYAKGGNEFAIALGLYGEAFGTVGYYWGLPGIASCADRR